MKGFDAIRPGYNWFISMTISVVPLCGYLPIGKAMRIAYQCSLHECRIVLVVKYIDTITQTPSHVLHSNFKILFKLVIVLQSHCQVHIEGDKYLLILHFKRKLQNGTGEVEPSLHALTMHATIILRCGSILPSRVSHKKISLTQHMVIPFLTMGPTRLDKQTHLYPDCSLATL